MKKYFIILILINFFSFSCSTNCRIDKKFFKNFKDCINLVQKIHEPGYSSSQKFRAYTFECLYAITGYEGRVDKGNEPHDFYPYSDSIDYMKEDIRIWEEWLEKNKCTMTLEKADSLIYVHSKNFPGLCWPFELKE